MNFSDRKNEGVDADEFISQGLKPPEGSELTIESLIELVDAASCTGRVRVDEVLSRIDLNGYSYADIAILNSYRVIDYWLNWEINELDKLFGASLGYSAEEQKTLSGVLAQAHMKICARLMVNRLKNPKLYESSSSAHQIYVIGDSHTLCMNGVSFNWNGLESSLRGLPIRGVKMFHLGAGRPSKYRNYFRSRLRSLPQNSELFLSIGEIDSRPNEGIFPQAYKAGMANLKEFETITRATVESFIKYVREELELAGHSGRQVTLMGLLPIGYAIRKGLPKGANEKQFIDVNVKINSAMREVAMNEGWKFIDLQAGALKLTSQELKALRLDDFHLTPQFYQKIGDWIVLS